MIKLIKFGVWTNLFYITAVASLSVWSSANFLLCFQWHCFSFILRMIYKVWCIDSFRTLSPIAYLLSNVFFMLASPELASVRENVAFLWVVCGLYCHIEKDWLAAMKDKAATLAWPYGSWHRLRSRLKGGHNGHHMPLIAGPGSRSSSHKPSIEIGTTETPCRDPNTQMVSSVVVVVVWTKHHCPCFNPASSQKITLLFPSACLGERSSNWKCQRWRTRPPMNLSLLWPNGWALIANIPLPFARPSSKL